MEFNNEEFFHLKGKETGEAFDLKRFSKWIINSMPYDEFRKFAKLSFINKRVDDTYDFDYIYHVIPANDTPRTRENYLKYLAYKLYQNLCTDGVELKDENA